MRRALREDDRDGVRDLAAAERPVHDQVEPGPRRAQYPAGYQEIVSRREVRERTGIRARQRRAAGFDGEADQRRRLDLIEEAPDALLDRFRALDVREPPVLDAGEPGEERLLHAGTEAQGEHPRVARIGAGHPERRLAVRLPVGEEEHDVRLWPGVLRLQRGFQGERDVGAASRADAADEPEGWIASAVDLAWF